MKDSLRSVLAAAGISAGCLCIWLGSNLRNKVDVGSSSYSASASNRVFSSLVASRDNEPSVPAVDYYAQIVSLLKQYYVEPITDDDKLADGAVKGMVTSLGDPQSLFMDPSEFIAYLNREKGVYEGIGVDLVLQQHGAKPTGNQLQPPPQDAQDAVATMSRFPSVVVSAVVPGGPADKAGVKVGDVVAEIDGHWVVEDSLLEKFKKARDLFNANKLTYSQIAPLQKELRDKTERALLPARTFPRLLLGKSGSINVSWTRDGVSRTTKIEKAVSTMPAFSESGGTIVLPMSESGAKGLETDLSGKKAVTIDLRYDPEGSFPAMLQCLQVLAPAGHYGEIVNQRSEGPTIVSVPTGNPKPPKVTLLVGPATRGPAAILALALSRHAGANLRGRLPTGNVMVKQDVELPQGYGYDLAIGEYQTEHSRSGGVMASAPIPKGVVAKANSSMLKHENRSTLVDGAAN